MKEGGVGGEFIALPLNGFCLCPFFFLSLYLFVSSSLCLFVSLSLWLFVSLTLRLMGQLTRQLMGINGEKFLFWEYELFRIWTNEWKTKTGKTPCAWCKRLWRAFDAVPAGNSRASSGFSACHIIPLSGCIHRKTINRNYWCPLKIFGDFWDFYFLGQPIYWTYKQPLCCNKMTE